MSSLITDPKKMEEFNALVESHGGKISIQELLKQLAETRIMTSQAYVANVASSEIETRSEGIKKKTETLKHFRDNSIIQEDFYGEDTSRLESRKKEIMLDEIERSTQAACLSDIEIETKYIQNKALEKEDLQEK